MPRHLLAGLAAIALLFAGSMALVAWWTAPRGTRPSVAAVERPAPAAQPGGAPSAAPAPSTSFTQARATAVPAGAPLEGASWSAPRRVDPARPRPPPQDPSLREGVAAARRGALASLRRELIAGFAHLEERVSRCAPGDVAFVLTLESVDGGIRIVEAQLASRGSASDAELACALAALRGVHVPAPSARAGSRWEMPFSVAALDHG